MAHQARLSMPWRTLDAAGAKPCATRRAPQHIRLNCMISVSPGHENKLRPGPPQDEARKLNDCAPFPWTFAEGSQGLSR